MNYLLRSALLAGIILLQSMESRAECNPKDFTFSDVEKSDTLDIIKIMSYAFSEQSRQESSDKNASGNFSAAPMPVSITYSESKSLAQKTLEERKFSYDRQQIKSFVRTALSQTGREMYSDCLAVQTILARVNSAAYRGGTFFLDVQWKPQGINSGIGNFKIRVINGSIEGQEEKIGTFVDKEVKQFRIARDPKLEAQISIVINGATYPVIEIPPVIEPVNFEFFPVQGKASKPREEGGNTCTDSAYLVSENGSAAGPDSKSCTLCVQRPKNGVLLPSTAAFQGPPSSKYVRSEISKSSEFEVCGRFYTIGPGKGSGRAEVPRGSTFSVWVAIPR